MTTEDVVKDPRVKALESSVAELVMCLENWIEIANDEDRRDYDDEAVARAKALLNDC